MSDNLNANAIVVNYLKELFESVSLVNTILFGTISERDLDKATIFPLVHIMPNGFRLSENRIEYLFDIAVVTERNIEPNSSDFYGSNMIDNLNEASAILIKVFNTLILTENEYDILLDDFPSADAIIFADKNLLDGYETSIVLSIQNEVGVCGNI